MQLSHRVILSGAVIGAAGFTAAPGLAQTMDVSIQIPRLSVAEYHRPYVAAWLEKAGEAPRTVAVWYDFDMANDEGKKWLSDVRRWWRASGRTLSLPADGVSGATRAPGVHKMSFTNGRKPLGKMSPGDYVLVVEAAREVGGREMVRVPFSWPPKPGQVAKASGTTELGTVSITFKR